MWRPGIQIISFGSRALRYKSSTAARGRRSSPSALTITNGRGEMRATQRSGARRGPSMMTFASADCSQLAGSGLGSSVDVAISIRCAESLPRNSVILSVVRRASPHRAMLAIEHDGVDRARRAIADLQRVPHRLQGAPHLQRRHVANEHATRTRLMLSKGRAHLIAVDVRGLDGLFRGHSPFDDVEEKLKQVLIL